MPQFINTNIASLNAQRNLNSSQSSLNTSLQRLSSGLRINSARDDAAGLAISERMTAQIKGLNQASRNANDGISLAQTAEGALGEIGNNLQRIRELAIQSRNATNSDSDRAALQSEVAQLKSEIDRVADQTSFNGIKLLNGDFTAQDFQVGADQGQTIQVASIADSNIAVLGSWTSVAQANISGASGTFSGLTVAATTDFKISDGTTDLLTINGGASGTTITASDLDAALGTAPTGYSFSGSFAAGDFKITKTDGSSMSIAVTNDGADAASNFTGTGFSGTVNNGTAAGAQTGFTNLDISTTSGADNAILAMDAALKAVNTSRADLGAIQNRFSSVISNLSTSSENLAAARSRIQDADYAVETANLSRTQILQQAGTAMLAQAKALPQNVLSLLQ